LNLAARLCGQAGPAGRTGPRRRDRHLVRAARRRGARPMAAEPPRAQAVSPTWQ
jgi:hypothetical protein